MYKRIVLKLSGEVLAGPRGFGLDADKIAEITGEIVEVHALGVEIGVVVGGGNIFRGDVYKRQPSRPPAWRICASSAGWTPRTTPPWPMPRNCCWTWGRSVK